MKKTETLKKSYQFKKVLTRGKRYYGEYINIMIIPNSRNKNYLGIAINTKLAKATKRNRLKRLIRESYKLIELNIKEGYSFVILCKKATNVKEITFNEVLKDIQNIVKKAGLSN